MHPVVLDEQVRRGRGDVEALARHEGGAVRRARVAVGRAPGVRPREAVVARRADRPELGRARLAAVRPGLGAARVVADRRVRGRVQLRVVVPRRARRQVADHGVAVARRRARLPAPLGARVGARVVPRVGVEGVERRGAAEHVPARGVRLRRRARVERHRAGVGARLGRRGAVAELAHLDEVVARRDAGRGRVADPLGRADRVGLGDERRAEEELEDDVLRRRGRVGVHVDGADAGAVGHGVRALEDVAAAVRGRQLAGERLRRERGLGRVVDDALAGEDRAAARVDVGLVALGLRAGAVEDDRLVRRHPAVADGRERHRLRGLDVGDAGQLEAVEALRGGLVDRDDLRERALLPRVRGGLLDRLLRRELRLAGEGRPAVQAARGGDHAPVAVARQADRDETAARGGEPADPLAEGDRVARAAGQRVVALELEPVGRVEPEQRGVGVEPRAGGGRGRGAADAGGERAAGVDQRGRGAEAVPVHAGAERARVGALRGGRADLPGARVAVGQRAGAVDRRVGGERRRRRRREYEQTGDDRRRVRDAHDLPPGCPLPGLPRPALPGIQPLAGGVVKSASAA